MLTTLSLLQPALQDEIANLRNVAVTGGERHDATERILSGISRLTNEVSDASQYAPPRDQMIYNQVGGPLSVQPKLSRSSYTYRFTQALKALREQLNTQTSRFGTNNQFSFSSQSKKTFLSSSSPKVQQDEKAEKNDALGELPDFGDTNGKNYNAEMAAQSGTGIRKPSFSTARDIDISDHRGMHIILPATAARATTSGSVTNLRSCVLDMSVPTTTTSNDGESSPTKQKRAAGRKAKPFASLAIKDVSNSLVIAGHVAGPAHITGVRNSVLVVNARQVRIHECENVSVFLWAGSHPIIEDCKDMRFAEIPAKYVSAIQLTALGPTTQGEQILILFQVDREPKRVGKPVEPSRRLQMAQIRGVTQLAGHDLRGRQGLDSCPVLGDDCPWRSVAEQQRCLASCGNLALKHMIYRTVEIEREPDSIRPNYCFFPARGWTVYIFAMSRRGVGNSLMMVKNGMAGWLVYGLHVTMEVSSLTNSVLCRCQMVFVAQ